MTLTIAARWRVSFKVQSLARVTMPTTKPTTKPSVDLLRLLQARNLREEMETMRYNWEKEALLSFRRMF